MSKTKSMEELEALAAKMSDEWLVVAMDNAWLILFAKGCLGHRSPYSSDGSVSEPWQEHTAYKREILRRMSGK